MASIMTPIISILTIINTLQQAYAASQLKSAAAAQTQTVAEGEKAAVQSTGMFAGIVNAFSSAGIPGVIAGIALATALVAALGVGIAMAIASTGAFNGDSGAQKAAGDINTLSNEIYKLTERANAIKNVTSQFDDLDKKIIKTAEDQKKMNELLDSATDKLDDEQKKTYEALATDKQRYEYLKQVEAESRKEANAKRQQQIDRIRKMSAGDRAALLSSNATDAKILEAQSAIYALNNNSLYEYIDTLEDAQEGVEKLTQSILENMSAEEA